MKQDTTSRRGVNHVPQAVVRLDVTQAQVDSLYAHFETVPDQRAARGQRYALVHVLVLTVLAKLAGETTLRGIAQWCHERRTLLTRLLRLPRARTPPATTFQRVLGQAQVVEAVEAVVQIWMAAQEQAAELVSGRVLALDGKVLRGTRTGANAQQVRLMSCYQPDQHLTLKQQVVPSTTNEITVAPQVLEGLPLEGRVVTGDAMQAQRALSQQIVDNLGDDCWKVKGDERNTLYEALLAWFAPPTCPPGTSPVPTDIQTSTQVDKGHGRLEWRTIRTSTALVE
jgi:hypothetical protein